MLAVAAGTCASSSALREVAKDGIDGDGRIVGDAFNGIEFVEGATATRGGVCGMTLALLVAAIDELAVLGEIGDAASVDLAAVVAVAPRAP